MGAQIAAHFANAGVPALLLDVTLTPRAQGLQRARALKPDPFFTPDTWTLITTGSFDDGLGRARTRPTGSSKPSSSGSTSSAACWRRSTPRGGRDRSSARTRRAFRSPRSRKDAATTSGGTGSARISSTRRVTCTCWRSFRRRRHDPTVVDAVAHFADHRLGKGVVIAKDSPNFIGNHIGLYGVMRILAMVASGEYTIEEVDAITGPALGRPKSATFRTLDLAGLDILGHVVDNLHERLDDPDARKCVRAAAVRRADARARPDWREGRPGLLQARQERGRRVGDPDARPGDARVPAAAVSRAGRPSKPARRSPTSASACGRCSTAKTRSGSFLRETLAPTLVYTARVTPAIAHSADDVDRVMRWGFGWELGPFELLTPSASSRSSTPRRRQRRTSMAGGVPRSGAGHRSGRNRLRDGECRPPHRTCRSCARRRSGRPSSRRTPAPASSILATACCASSSTRR